MTASLTFDHAAFPCFDVGATRRFYAELLGWPVVHAQSGPVSGAAADGWGSGEYLLLAFGLPGGGVIDFFSFDGLARPPKDDLPKDIRHLALALPTRADVLGYKERLAAAGVDHWLETHETDDVHVYLTDPNGVVLELLAVEDGARGRTGSASAAAQVVGRWLTQREARGEPGR